MHYYLREYEQAVEAYTAALESDVVEELRYSILLNRGAALAALGQIEAARSDYEESENQHDTDPLIFHNRGNLEIDDGNYELALEYLNTSLELGSTDHKTTQFRGVALRNLGRLGEAAIRTC